MDIILLYRKKDKGRNSIETLFTPLDKIKGVRRIELPCDLHSIKNIFKLLIFSFRLKGKNIHITGDVYYMAFFLFWKQVIITIHDCSHYENMRVGLKRYIYGVIWHRMPLFFAKKIVVISPFTKKQLLSNFNIDTSKIIVIPNSYISVKKEININKGQGKYEILVIGTKINKNIEGLIKAVKLKKDILLTIVGTLPEKLKVELEKNKIEYVSVYDISRKQLEFHYNKASLLFFASLREGFGLPILEAQSCGLPVITSNVTSMPYVAGKGAAIVNPYSVEEISLAIQEIRFNKDYREKLIEEGYRNIERFSEGEFRNSYLSLYKQVFTQKS